MRGGRRSVLRLYINEVGCAEGFCNRGWEVLSETRTCLSLQTRTSTPMRRLLTFLLVSTLMATAQKTPAPASADTSFPNADELNQMAARFAPVNLEVDLSSLSAGDKKALAKLI